MRIACLSCLPILAGFFASLWIPSLCWSESQDLCTMVSKTPLVAPGPARIDGTTSYVYRSVGSTALRLHVFSPSITEGPPVARPALIFVFGGGWMFGTVSEFVPPAQYFVHRGLTTIVVDYRTFCRDRVNIVDEMADVKSAVGWVRSHAADLGVDPNRIAVSGGSSGGQLALSTAIFNQSGTKEDGRSISSKPDLLVLFYPCVDETTKEEQVYHDAIGLRGRAVSPLYHIHSRLPPTILFTGTADSLHSEDVNYCAEATQHGNTCELIDYAGAPHGFMNPRVRERNWYDEALSATDRFLVRKGYLKPPT